MTGMIIAAACTALATLAISYLADPQRRRSSGLPPAPQGTHWNLEIYKPYATTYQKMQLIEDTTGEIIGQFSWRIYHHRFERWGKGRDIIRKYKRKQRGNNYHPDEYTITRKSL